MEDLSERSEGFFESVPEDNAEEYIRRDIEGSDVDTRRRAACDLVKALSKSFEALKISLFVMDLHAIVKWLNCF